MMNSDRKYYPLRADLVSSVASARIPKPLSTLTFGQANHLHLARPEYSLGKVRLGYAILTLQRALYVSLGIILDIGEIQASLRRADGTATFATQT
jgi:hypothetical protein